MLLALVMVLSAFPISAFAAPASDIPEKMLDNPIVRALAYTGYNVQKQKDNGTIYQTGHYGGALKNNAPSILSDIHYSTSLTGKETVSDSSTVTGKAPNIARFEQYGLCCASFVTYYICNYLPNIEGVDTQFITDAQHMGHILHGQHQREFVKRVVFGFSHSVPFYLPGGRVLVLCFATQFLRLLHGQIGPLLLVVIRLVAQGDALLLQLLQPFPVDLNTSGAGLRDGVVPEDPAHVMEQPGHCQHRRGRTVFLQMVQKVLCILTALLGGLGQPICGFLLVAGNLLTSKVQLAQHILGVVVSPLC